MEHFLNLLWLTLAVCGYLWIGLNTSGRSKRHSLFTCIVAVTILVFLLFPIISMTDDLQAAQNMAQEVPGCSVRRQADLILNGTLAAALHTHMVALVTMPMELSTALYRNSFALQPLQPLADWTTSVRGVRPPPSAVL